MRKVRNQSPAQLENLGKGRRYRWPKGKSGNPLGRPPKDPMRRRIWEAARHVSPPPPIGPPPPAEPSP